MWNRRHLRLGLYVIAVTVVIAVAIGTGSDVAAVEPASSSVVEYDVENETRPHENPDEINEDGDDRRVGDHLSSEMAVLLGDSAVEISDEEYEQARELLGDDYDDLLGKYGAVSDDIDAEPTAETFGELRDEQESVSESAEEFDETHSEYERAVREGDDERARELARELRRIADDLNDSATEVDRQYEALEADTGIDFTDSRASIEETRLRVTENASAIEESEFEESALTAQLNRTNISFHDPAAITGQLTTTNGTPIADAELQIRLDADTFTTVTDENGTFTAVYRPTRAYLNASALSIAYRPDDEELYMSSETNMTVEITEQADSTVELNTSTAGIAFDEEVRASGTVFVDGEQRVSGLPVVLMVDDERLETAETQPEGQYDLNGIVPAAVPAGDTDLRGAIDQQDSAVATAAATTPVTVRSTATDLSLTASESDTDEDRITVSGRLTTEPGTPLAAREIVVSIEGTHVGTLETESDGRFQATYALPAGDVTAESVTIEGRFTGAGTNLESSTAAHQVSLSSMGPSEADEAADSTLGSPMGWITDRGALIGLSLIVLVAGAVVMAWNQRERWERFFGKRTAETAATVGDDDSDGRRSKPTNLQDGADVDGVDLQIERARQSLKDERLEDAVRIAYATVRSRLDQRTSEESVDTHWEFYRRLQSASSIDPTQLRTLTEAYESATYAPQGVSREIAENAISATVELIDSER